MLGRPKIGFGLAARFGVQAAPYRRQWAGDLGGLGYNPLPAARAALARGFPALLGSITQRPKPAALRANTEVFQRLTRESIEPTWLSNGVRGILMGLSVPVVDALAKEHKYKPLGGKALHRSADGLLHHSSHPRFGSSTPLGRQSVKLTSTAMLARELGQRSLPTKSSLPATH